MVDEIKIVVQTKKNHEESKITTLTDSTREDAHTTKLMVGTLSRALQEQHEKSQPSLYIDETIEVPKTLYTIDNSSEADLLLATK